MTKVLIFGGSGMLGHKLVQNFRGRFETFATLRGDPAEYAHTELFEADRTFGGVDVTDDAKVESIVGSLRPDVVVNAVGIVKQRSSSKDVLPTLLINSIFPHRLATLSDRYGFRTITISTDCVFSGQKGKYSEDDPPDALDLYGRSKRFGEVGYGNTLTLRTSIIGRELATAQGLVEWFLSNKGSTVSGYSKAIFSGFPTAVLADIIGGLIESHPTLSGVYHVSSEPIDKCTLLRLIKSRTGVDIEITEDESVRIDRSLNSDRFRKATGFAPSSWSDMIDQMCSDPSPYETWRDPAR